MRLLWYTLFLFCFISAGVLIFPNYQFQGSYFFFMMLENSPLWYAFAGFFGFGLFSGVFLMISIRSYYAAKKWEEKKAKEKFEKEVQKKEQEIRKEMEEKTIF